MVIDAAALREGEFKLTDAVEEKDKGAWGAYKAERMLHFKGKCFAAAGLGSREAWTAFYDAMLAAFWAPPSGPSSRGPSVEELRNAERCAVKAAFRMVNVGRKQSDGEQLNQKKNKKK